MPKGPTVDDILGVCLDRRDRVGSIEVKTDPSNIIDFSGGGYMIKSINVSTAASLVAAAGGFS